MCVEVRVEVRDEVRVGVRVVKVVQTVALAVGSFGSTVALVSGYLIVRGPFLGRATLAPRPLLVTLGVFLVGVVVAAWGITTYARERV